MIKQKPAHRAGKPLPPLLFCQNLGQLHPCPGNGGQMATMKNLNCTFSEILEHVGDISQGGILYK